MLPDTLGPLSSSLPFSDAEGANHEVQEAFQPMKHEPYSLAGMHVKRSGSSNRIFFQEVGMTLNASIVPSIKAAYLKEVS